MIRNILDSNSNVIGTLELPDNTSEDVWTYQLGLYTFSQPEPLYVLAQVIGGIVVDLQNTVLDISDAANLITFAIYLLTGQTCQYVVRVDNLNPIPDIGWSYDGTTFTPPS